MRYLTLSFALALAACSSSTNNGTSSTGATTAGAGTTTGSGSTTTTGSGSTTGAATATAGTATAGSTTGAAGTTGACAGCVSITYSNVDIHPAAKAALTAIGFPIPSLTTGQYVLLLNEVGIKGGAAALTVIGSDYITSAAGPYTFQVDPSQAVLGVLAGINIDAGYTPGVDAGTVTSLPQPTCAQWAALVEGAGTILDAGGTTAVVADFLADAGFSDYIMPSGSQVGGIASPPTTAVTGAFAYGVPMSYATMLNCAGSTAKTTRDTDQGVALIYATNGTPGTGTPLTGVSFSVNGAGNTTAPAATYYAGEYSSTITTQTDATGVATALNVEPGKLGFATVSATDPASDSFFPQGAGVATQANAFFNVTVGTQQ